MNQYQRITAMGQIADFAAMVARNNDVSEKELAAIFRELADLLNDK